MSARTIWTAFMAAMMLAIGYADAQTSSPAASELDIRIYPLETDLPAELPSCQIENAASCTASLADALKIIHSPKWQMALSDRFSKVRLQLAPGTYRLTAPLYLRWGTGATKNVQLELSGTSKTTVITGAFPVENWVLASSTELPKRLSSKVRNKLLVADVAHLNLPINVLPHARGFGLPIRPVLTELFVDNAVQQLAGWPKVGFGKLARPAHLQLDDKKTFAIEGRTVSDWADEPNLQVHAFWGWDWAAQCYLVAAKNIETNTLTLFGTGSPYGIKSGQRVRVENALAELDSPGEWYLDRSTAKLFYLPVSSFQGKGAELSVATGLLDIESSEKVLVHNLIFEKVRGDAVQVKGSHDVVFDNITIRLTGNRGLVVENSSNSGVRNSLIEDNGEGGVFLSGGDRINLKGAGNFLETSVLRRFSRLVMTYRFAVELAGVGQRVTGNTISDAPHTAIFFKGNNHLIDSNEIFDVVRKTSDAGAIYVGRDYTVHGTIIENNFLHDIKAYSNTLEVKGIYIDDQASGIAVRSNVFARVQQPVFLGGGRDNLIERNIFFQSSPAVHLDARGITTQRKESLDPNGTLQRGLNAVPYRDAVYGKRFPHLANIREDDFGAPKYNIFRNNIIVDGQMTRIAQEAQAGIEIKDNQQASESIFEKNMPGSARLRPEDFRLAKGH